MIRTPLWAAVAAAALTLPLAAQTCPPHWSMDFGVPGMAGAQPSVDAFEVFDDGSGQALYAGGLFAQAGGNAAVNIARWRGTSWSPVGGGLPGRVRALFVHDDGSGPALYAGGDLAGGVMRWNGVSWSALGSGVNGPVHALGSYDDGTGNALFAAGQFAVAGGVSALNIARWKGGAWSALGPGLNGRVQALAVFDSGGGLELVAGGEFITSGTNLVQRIARWNGSVWSPLGSGANLPVRALAVFNDGSGFKLFAGGDFTFVGGVPALHVGRFDGQSWSSAGTGLPNGSVAVFTSHDDGGGARLVAGGSFLDAASSLAYLARWDGASWESPGGGLDDDCAALIEWDPGVFPSGNALYAGGDFETAGGFVSRRIARWDDDDPAPTKYCTAKVNSAGCTTSIAAVGAPSASAGSGFSIRGYNMLPGVVGLLFYGTSGSQALPFQGGWLCVLPPAKRVGIQKASGGVGCAGIFSFDFNTHIASGADPALGVGASVWCQWWSRDKGFSPPDATNLTDGLQFLICQ